MADIASLIAEAQDRGEFSRLMNSRQGQFGPPNEPLIGAQLLPERVVDKNQYEEWGIRLRAVVANASTRYSPPQKRGNELFYAFNVKLGESDIEWEFTAWEYDQWKALLDTNPDMDAMATFLRLFANRIVMPLSIHNEVNRWQVIVGSQIALSGDGNYNETVTYLNPSGHRFNAGGTWSSDSYDPWEDITAMADMFTNKGKTLRRIITSRQVISILANNANVKNRVGLAVIVGTSVVSLAGRATPEAMNAALARDGLPPFEEYNSKYNTESASYYYLPRNVMVFIAETNNEERVDLGNMNPPLTLTNTLGYTGIGTPSGTNVPGRTYDIDTKTSKPRGIIFQGWQTSLPIILDSESVGAIAAIS